MDVSSAVMRALVFIIFYLNFSTADTHSLQYFNTAVRGLNFPEFTTVGQVDGQQIDYYNSEIRREIPKTQWMEKITADDPQYWKRETQDSNENQEVFKESVDKLMQRFNQTAGVHTVQWMYGCEQDDDGTIRGYEQYGYDGEDFVSLDLTTKTWTAAKPQAVITKHKWDTSAIGGRVNYLQNDCIDWLNKFLNYGKESLLRKDRPETSLFQKEVNPEVVCHATGFFPKTLMMSWQKDGEDVNEDVEYRETLPNPDGSFQKRIILTVPAEELQKHTYTCVVQHSSLEKDLVLRVSERRILRDGGSDRGQIGIIVGVVVALVVLVVLVVVVVGIVVWKKKTSGFRRVPPKPSSEEDSSSSNS